MKNLAGVEDTDKHITQELEYAGIEITEGARSEGEVPYTLTGQLGSWRFYRAWYYWIASAPDGEGLPLDVATGLHNKEYHIKGEREPDTYGQAVRVVGHCGCPPPGEWVNHYDAEGRELVLDLDGKKERDWNYFVERGIIDPEEHNLRFVKSLESIVVRSEIGLYHIDTQEGLNEFARVIKELQ